MGSEERVKETRKEIEEEVMGKQFNQEVAWSIFEAFASGNFNVVADYAYRSIDSFYNSSVEFVRAKKKYKQRLEQEFGQFGREE